MTKSQDFSGAGSNQSSRLQTSPAQPGEMHCCLYSLHRPKCFPLLHRLLHSAGPSPLREATRTRTKSSPNTESVWKQVLWPLDYWGGKKYNVSLHIQLPPGVGLSCLMVERCKRARPSIYLRQPSPKSKSMKRRTFQELNTPMTLS